jgi:hypothetical protein
MALKDVLKKGTVPPVAADLIVGGIGIDTVGKRLYFKADDGTVVPHDLNTPAGTIAATTVQEAINELDTEKAKKGTNNDITSLTALANINGGQIAGFRNRIINGDMRVAQRGISGTATGAMYTLDRWFAFQTGTALAWSKQVMSVDGITASDTFYVTGAAGNTVFNLSQRIEASNSRDLGGKSVTVSYMVYQTSGSTVSVGTQLLYCTTRDTFPATNLIGSIASTSVPTSVWTKVSGTVSVPAAASTGIQVILWANSTAITTGVVAITNVQLEIGSVATPFEQRPYGMELALCQRYYETINTLVMHSPYTANSTSSEMVSTWIFKQSKRATGAAIQSVTSISPSNAGLDSCNIQLVTTPSANTVTSIAATASSEL